MRKFHFTLVAAIVAGAITHPAAAQQLCFPEASDFPTVDIPVPEPALTADGEERLMITAGQINLVDENRVDFDGGLAFRYGERSISAERASFDMQTETAEINGTVAYRDPRVTIHGEDARVDTRGRIITFRGGGFELPLRGAQGAAEAILIRGDNTIGLRSVNFTTCVTEPRDWELLARELEMDVESGSGTARGFRLMFKGLPVLASPWVTFPLDDRRRSGMLTPSFSNRDRTGADFSVPFYLNLAPNYDLTLTTRFTQRRGTQANSEFRYLLPRTDGQLQVEYLPKDAELEFSRYYFGYSNVTSLGEAWQFVADVQEVSDSFYFEDLRNSLSEASQTHLNRALELSYRAPRWSFLARAQDIQTIDPFINPGLAPYRRLPQFLMAGNWRRNAFRLISRNELVRFDRQVGVTGWRLDLEEELSLDFRRPGMFLSPTLALRQTNYWLDGDSVERYAFLSRETEFSRTLPAASLDAGLTFERTVPERGWLQTLEPRALYVHVPFEEQSHLPIFDTVEPTFNFVQLFRKYRYLGADRIADTDQLSVGVTTRLIDLATGRERLAATLGQTRYLRPQRVTLHHKSFPLGSASDYIAEIAMNLQTSWRLGLGYQWDSEAAETSRTEARFEYRPNEDRMLGLSYRYQEDVLEQGDVSITWPLGDAGRFIAHASYSFLDEKPLERFIGWEFVSCCWRMQVYSRDYISRRTGESDRSLNVQILLRGFAEPGESAESLLERGILGYRRFD
ncbi:MAG: LPS assembly protein LptD, partial [Rhodospirillaceae bacterium]|nr:LPS assembly protein LptD [Rhodospirillaceae bacterium]